MSLYFYRKKAASKKIVHKAADVTGEFIRNRFTDKFVKYVKETIIPPEKKEQWIKRIIIK